MILAHGSVVDHATTVTLVGTALAVHAALWFRNPTRSATPVRWAAAAALTLLLATSPWVESLADTGLVGHMVQHLLLLVVVPPLILAARPLTTASRALHPGPAGDLALRRVRQALEPVWRPAAVVIATAVLYGTHLTGLYERALTDPVLHDAEHLAYLGSATLLWAAILRGPARTGGTRAGLAAAAMVPVIVLGLVLTTADTPLYHHYVVALGPTGALADQRAGGALMWLGAMAGLLPLTVRAVWRWAADDHNRQLAREGLVELGRRP